ncbi:lipase member N isoform X3 [Mesocricetus auratus]|uniref:Lipase member N isoform X3 n=1 Tax=Mesocricetus auratus TaxID=10036 RepID=A0ABM2XEQ5_MESAU|nr:lipase member N isoform X3 [Mesocricetus auratus]
MPMMWLFLTTACLIRGTLSVSELLDLENEVNPEVWMNASEIIIYNGYPSEEYEVTTADGYILTLNRIPHGRAQAGHTGPRPVVYLQHALFADNAYWFENFANGSLGFLLSDAGYDVWMGNSRGNTWSRRHKTLSANEEKFWAFSFDEMAKYDLPGIIDFIVNKTGQEKLYFIGHSLGTTIGFLLEDKKAKSSYIKICSRKLLRPICSEFMSLWAGFNKKNVNMSRLDVYLSHAPTGSSIQNILHIKQLYRSDEFRAYDWGSEAENMNHYNQSRPPIYDLTAMKVPTAIWAGGHDALITPQDVARVLPQVTNLRYFKLFPDWNHFDFVWGLDAPQRLYSKIIGLMREYL